MSTHNMFSWENKKIMLISPFIWSYADGDVSDSFAFLQSDQAHHDMPLPSFDMLQILKW